MVNDDNKIIQFPNNNEIEDKNLNSTDTEQNESYKMDEDNYLSEESEKQIIRLMKQMKDMLGMLEAQWKATEKEFAIKDEHMRKLYAFNNEHYTPPETTEKKNDENDADMFNGLDALTEQDVIDIFGEDHPIIGVEHTQTMDRVKSIVEDFSSWLNGINEYKQIHDAYLQLIEEKEHIEIEKLKLCISQEPDPEKCKEIQKMIDLYYNRKYIDFIRDPIPEKSMNSIIETFSNPTKIQYLVNRCRTKLDSIGIPNKFILEISQLEKRFLPEEFHCNNNVFLLYFMNLVVFSNINDKKDDNRNKAICIVILMDKFIRNTLTDEIKEHILNNLIAFEKQFIGKLTVNK